MAMAARATMIGTWTWVSVPTVALLRTMIHSARRIPTKLAPPLVDVCCFRSTRRATSFDAGTQTARRGRITMRVLLRGKCVAAMSRHIMVVAMVNAVAMRTP
jgi:hypothetical protein